MQDFLGRADGSKRVRAIQTINITSVKILNVKALPVINGKYKLESTIKGISNVAKIPTIKILLKIV